MTNDTTRTRNVLLALLVGGALLLTAPSATAQNGETELGELRVLDDLGDDMHDAVVTCEFWIAGHDMPVENGTLVVKSVPDNGTVLNDTWEADENGTFVNGPHELEAGDYVVEAFYEHELVLLDGDLIVPAAAPREFTVDECPPEPMCPSDLSAEARSDGSVHLTFTPAEGSEGTNIYRSVGGEDPVLLAELGAEATGFHDESTEPGTTYTYEARAVFDGEETTGCSTVEVTAIPVFPTALGALAASTVGILAYAGLRRRL